MTSSECTSVHGRVADQPFAQLDRRHHLRVAVADRRLHLQRLFFFVDERNAERAVIDEPLHQVRKTGQQLVEIENRAHLAPDLRQRLERVRVLAF
jgi:hypothetical protein